MDIFISVVISCVAGRFFFVLGMMVLTAGYMPAYAVDLDAELSSKGVLEKPAFRFVETAFVDYHDGGKLRDILSGQNKTISFTANSSNPSVRDLVGRVNAYLSQDLRSPTRITDMSLDYQASLVGGDNSATIDYSLTMKPAISNYVVAKYSGNITALDAQWIGVSLDGPAVVKTEQYGDVDINRLGGFVSKAMPNLNIGDSQVQKLLNIDLVDSSSLVQQPISNWQRMFDPAYTLTETSGWGYNGSKVAITTFTVGESSLGVVQNTVTNTVDFTLDKSYEIQTVQHASSATIQVDGQANLVAVSGGQVTFVTTPQSVNNNPVPSTGLSVQMIYAMAGFAAAIAVGIFVWSSKKMKESLKKEKDTGPYPAFEYEKRRHWADRFDANRKKDSGQE